MTRRIVSYTSEGATVFRNLQLAADNAPRVLMNKGEETSVEFDLTAYLETGETVTDATATTSGIATPTLATTGTKVTASGITPSNGYATLTFTTSTGEKIATKLYVAERCTSMRGDYGGMWG